MFERISTRPVPSPFLLPLRRGTDTDREWGGLRLQDNAGGLYQVIWECYKVGNSIRCNNKVTEYILVDNVTDPDHLSLAFDVNMNYNCTYIINNTLYWKWYDTTILAHSVMQIPNVTSVYCSLDDARPDADTWNDVILVYIRNDVMYYRIQRDRYTVEYKLMDAPYRKIMQGGMTKGHRFQVRHVHEDPRKKGD